MKKVIFALVLFMISLSVVSAADNKLYLTEKDNKIYYDTNLYDENQFMRHIDMVPGGSYLDELVIENGAPFDLTLYLKIIEEQQNEQADELLDNIFMKVYLDNNLIYDGKVKGLDYKLQGVNLQDSILLKKFNTGDKAKIKVELYLSKEYSNKSYNDYSHLKWRFIAQFDKSKVKDADVVVEVVPAPITGINKNYIPIIISSIGLCTLGCIIIILLKKKKK